MADLQLVGGGDELAAVPEADCRLDGEKICNGGGQKNHDRENAVDEFKLFLLHLLSNSYV